MRKFALMMFLSVATVLLIYLAGMWFDTLIPQ